MFNFKTNVPEIDQENAMLFKAATLLQKCGNSPNLTTQEFYDAMMAEGIEFDNEDFSKLSTAAIAIETMMNLDLLAGELEEEPTIH